MSYFHLGLSSFPTAKSAELVFYDYVLSVVQFGRFFLSLGMGCSCSKQAVSPRCELGSGLPRLLNAVPLKDRHSAESTTHTKLKRNEEYQEKAETQTFCRASCTSNQLSCTSSSERWHQDLLQVSFESKQKLQDPQFVAMRCDLDGSGDLDIHELKQAAPVFGMRLDQERLQQLMATHGQQQVDCSIMLGKDQSMATQQRISRQRFAELMADFQASGFTTKSLRGLESYGAALIRIFLTD